MLELRTFTTAEAAAGVLGEIRRLLDQGFGGDFSEEDWEHTLGGRHVVVTEDGEVVSHAAVVPRVLTAADRRFRTGYVEGVATSLSRMGEGLGSLAMAEVTQLVPRDFEFGALSTGRHRFYERLGWERWRGWTFVHDGEELIRTEEEDDGLMVLRFGPSQDLDLTLPLACESRPGDDW